MVTGRTMQDSESRAKVYEAAEYLARSRVRLEGLRKALGETHAAHSMFQEEARIEKERTEKLRAVLFETGYKPDRQLLIAEVAVLRAPENRDEAVQKTVAAILLELT